MSMPRWTPSTSAIRRTSKNSTFNSRRIAKMNDKPQNGPGRMPPPVEHRFLKGSSGNKQGRPKGSIDLKKLTRKVALKKHRVLVNGRPVRKTLFQLVIESVIRGAASGAPSMVSLHNEIRAKVRPMEQKQQCALLVVPEGLPAEAHKPKE